MASVRMRVGGVFPLRKSSTACIASAACRPGFWSAVTTIRPSRTALSASLFVALIINPVLSARYQKVKPVKSKGNPHPKEPIIKRFYLFLLKWCLRHRWVVVLSSFVMLVAAVTAFSMFGKGTAFFPETEPKRAYVNIKAQEGTNLDTSDKLVAQVEKIVSEYEDIRYVISNIGSLGGDPFSQGILYSL